VFTKTTTFKGSVMLHILADIMSLMQYKQSQELNQHRLERCLCCGKQYPWLHGCYPRKADRSSNQEESLNPILIQRYYCPGCHKTCSVLPECIPPHRWYLWEIQQIALMLILKGASFNSTAKEIIPSRHTISRWIARIKEQFHLHKDTLCNHIIDLGRTIGFADFWQACLGHFSLAQAMRLCHVAGLPVP
jgi:transposase-like protein